MSLPFGIVLGTGGRKRSTNFEREGSRIGWTVKIEFHQNHQPREMNHLGASPEVSEQKPKN